MPPSESGHVLIGPHKIAYSIRRSTRRRRSLGLLVSREGDVRVLVPARAKISAIEEFVRRQTWWIGKKLDGVRQRREVNPPPRFEPGTRISFQGEFYTLRVTALGGRPQGCEIVGWEIVVHLPDAGLDLIEGSELPQRSPPLEGGDRGGVLSARTKVRLCETPTLPGTSRLGSFAGKEISSPQDRESVSCCTNPTPDPALKGRGTHVESAGCLSPSSPLCEEIRLEIILWYKRQARRVFRERAEYWSGITGLRPRRVSVSNPRRQWGSCSAGNDVRLNWRLITLAPALLDYVIVHELCHIAHKDHSARFWRTVERWVPEWRVRRRELRGVDVGFEVDKVSGVE